MSFKVVIVNISGIIDRMDGHQILSELKRRRLSFADIGRCLSPPTSRQAVRNTAYRHGLITSVRIMYALAEAIERDPLHVFPELASYAGTEDKKPSSERNTPNGQPNRWRGHRVGPHATLLNHAPVRDRNVNVRGDE